MNINDVIPGTYVKPSSHFSAGVLEGAFPGGSITSETRFEVEVVCHRAQTKTGTQQGVIVQRVENDVKNYPSPPYIWEPSLFRSEFEPIQAPTVAERVGA